MSGYSLLINCSFDTAKNKHFYHRGEVKKEMIPLQNKRKNHILAKKKLCYLQKRTYYDNDHNERNYCHYTEKYRSNAHIICYNTF